MIFHFVRGGRERALVWLAKFVVLTAVAVASTDSVVTRDTLVYKDGDRVHGVLVTRAENQIVFRSDRFGELRVSVADAVVIMAERPPAPKPDSAVAGPPMAVANAVAVSAKAETSAVAAETERAGIWDRFSGSVLTARVRNFFGPWHGKIAFSSEAVSDSAERSNYAVESQVKRKWERDEVQVNARFDYAETNALRTTDMIKGSGSWRHEFNAKQFAHYRPSVEWNRASKRSGVPNDYVLLQQEVGVGYHIHTSATRKIRAGVSQNLFDLWNTAPTSEHTTRGVQSVFEELEFKLPWQMGLTQRGVWYPVRGQDDGWENRVEVNKKLTETLSTAVRHEIRRENPDGSSQDYTRLKLLFGLEF